MKKDKFLKQMSMVFQAHPWHGIHIGKNAPEEVQAYIEILPTDTVKYELGKKSGYLKVDRPLPFSNVCPTLYGFVPQTLCSLKVGKVFSKCINGKKIEGDGDPLDICIITEKTINHNGVLLRARPIGGLAMIDGGKADDKIIAVLKDDAIYNDLTDIDGCPALVRRLKHYFLTYKNMPDESKKCEIIESYGRKRAYEVINASQQDYNKTYPDMQKTISRIFQ